MTVIPIRRPAGHPPRWMVPALIALLLAGAACSPTVRVEAPDRPIEINLNVRIDQEVRITVDRELDEAIRANPDIF